MSKLSMSLSLLFSSLSAKYKWHLKKAFSSFLVIHFNNHLLKMFSQVLFHDIKEGSFLTTFKLMLRLLLHIIFVLD